ncbi:FtsK/SpoIIIE domain-containing protein [Nocardioides sp.]|uniref:FtsK/SpoIIIE domain-containing protein n=1 Tax=Nocardioides sp. TaxID=35761 RepID=UPI00272203B4|nr:FtsK/SpoIIIE domain-containing protein [Nocardioides sp.]MDO9454779.1 FtsK/SpoIIIE domain-containing protein [Nocardioides sp.]
MRFSLTVVDGATGAHRDVLVDADPQTPVSGVLPALLRVTGDGSMHDSFARRSPVWVDGRRVDNEESLRAAGVRAGVQVALHEPGTAVPGLPPGVVEIRVVSGPGAGRVHRLGIGEHRIGNGAVGMSLPDVMLPADSLTIRVTTSATVEVVACGLDSVLVDGRDPAEPDPEGDDAYASEHDDLPDEALTRRERKKRKKRRRCEAKLLKNADTRRGRKRAARLAAADDEPLAWPEGADLRLAGTLLQWRRVWQPDADATASPDILGIDFNRPPRLLPPAPERSFVLPDEPRKPRRVSIPWPMVLAPMVMAGPMALIFGSYRFLLFALMSPLMAMFNFVTNRRGAAREYREKIVEFRIDDRSVRQRIARALRAERDELRQIHPDPAEVLLQVVGPGQGLWCRRRSDDDYLALRLGVADRPSRISVRERGRKETDEPRPPDELGDVPVALSLRDLAVVGAWGDQHVVDATARWMVGQAAALHTPRDLQVVVLTRPDREDQWSWLRWLPHCRRDGETVGALVGTDQETSARRVGELVHLIAGRAENAAPAMGGKVLSPAPDILVVLDGARRLRALPGIVTLLREGPAVGVYTLCLDDDQNALPEECRAVLDVGESLVELRRTGSEAVARIRPDLVEWAWAERVARSLAPVRDTTPDVESSSLPSSARLLECIALEDPTGALVAARWGPAARTDVVIGAGFDGPFRLDIRKDGPHALIAGTTGSGKSEFLQTIVASLAVSNSPDQLTFVLVDYKGGSAFKDCALLPHTVGMVTDLDTHLVGRALTSLGAELRRREHLLAVPGAKDLEDYWALQRRDPDLPTIPRLAIVIDEFASLKAELPDFVTGLVTIAQRGRSLGIHLILATQRPSGVISNDIRANTNLRIALRVTDEAESRDVIDASDSATIGPDQPGRGYARLGHSSLLPFQSGRVGGARPRTSSAAVATAPDPLVWPIPWDRIGQQAPSRPREEGSDTDEGDTDLSVLVEAVTEAARLRGIDDPHSPWLPELPTPITLDQLRERAGDLPVGSAPWALEDHPADQAQRARLFTLGESGHLYVVGGPRSGRSTALRTIAVGLVETMTSRDLHVYGLDCGNGALLPLTALPHTGAVVQRTEVERAGRLLDRLGEEAMRRQQVLGQSGFADIDEQRAAAAPEDRLPYVVLLIDRWEGFVADLADADMGRLNDRVFSLLREGASVGIHLVVSGDRTLLSGRVATLVEHKLLLRLPDKGDYSMAGLRAKDVPDTIADGRGMWSEVGTEAQIAILGDDVSGAAQSAYVREVGRRLAEAERGLPPAPPELQPAGLAVLPTDLDAATVLEGLGATVPVGSVPLGVGGDRLDLLTIESVTAPVLVVGPPRSGRTTTLCFVARWAEQTGLDVLGLTPTPNALSELLGDKSLVGSDHDPQVVVERLRALADGSVVLIDDAETLREGPLAPLLLAVVRQARDRRFSMVAAGGTSEMSSGFSGWIAEARKGRKGLLLSPQEVLQGDIFGGRVARTSLVSRVQPGRGVLFAGDGDQAMVQVPR